MTALRTMKPEDAEGVCALYRRVGLDEISPSQWRNRWDRYPLAKEFEDVPRGWVLAEEGGTVRGAFANIWMMCDLGGKPIRAGIGCEWGVESDNRMLSLQLLLSFLGQRTADVCIVGSANPVASQILTGLKIARIPSPGYDSPLLWATHPTQFAGAALGKRGVRGAAILAWPVGAVLGTADILKRSGRGRITSTVREIETFDERFDAFWDALRKGPVRLRSVRTRDVLDWRFSSTEENGGRVILVSEENAGLAGYVVLARRQSPELGTDLYDVVDLQALSDAAVVYRDLLLAAIRIARTRGAGALKLMTGDAMKRGVAMALKPYSYQSPVWQTYFKSRDRELAQRLARPQAWDFSPFDNF